MRYTIVILLGMALLGSACKKMLDEPSRRALTEENMWQNKNDARAATYGCYALIRAALMNENAHWVYGDMRGGDFRVTKRGDLQALVDNNLNASYATADQWRDWRRFYAAIAQCNLAIERLPEVVKNDYRYSVNDMELDRSQVRFLRAFLYYYIVRIWGDVPLIATVNDGSFKPVARSSAQQVLDFAIQDALAAAYGLPWKYDGRSPEQQGDYQGQGEGHHTDISATRGMAYTLLAHLYAWKGDYTNALQNTRNVIDNQALTGYNFVSTADLTRLDGSFRGRGLSNIFQVDLNFDHAEFSTTGQLEDWTLRLPDIPKSESEIYVPKDSILGIYSEANDQRATLFFSQLNDAFPVFYKMKQVNTAVTNPTLRFYTSAIIIFRYEELYLLQAECKARLGLGDAIGDLNNIRSRRGLKSLPGSPSQQALLDAIFMERRRELIGEGWYWYDLIHFNKIPQYTQLTQQDVNNGAAYWPVSKAALATNSALVQNSFWR
ncbi:RagB/SusD family nutrient uptake outer membrane protein [Chitinophaga agrisoli]|uniref:RagB/SusD family nutrient uptake outer membrane protein n=1 Tax=Chitinophaga agrisoli TaxID=2607653 RepID=A0A5B2W1N5_9BACT|nr:RagB/SusD family nutrient uptake outer membrane protein [Chitinophaga agrisoli]KAA2244818.1 RagB/SusD family nutrient uptake outer membrane protein [Chitinophaga agrisoli]